MLTFSLDQVMFRQPLDFNPLFHAIAIISIHYTPPFTFINSLISFYSSFQIFGHLLNLRSFDSLKGSLTCKHAFLPTVFSGIGLIPIATIILATYLRNWAHVISITIVKFMVNQCPFLFETLIRVDNNTFFFQQHFKVACNHLSPLHACVSSF